MSSVIPYIQSTGIQIEEAEFMVNTVNPTVGVRVAQQNVQNSNKPFDPGQTVTPSSPAAVNGHDTDDALAVAPDIRGDLAAMNNVNQSLAVGKGVVDVASKSVDSLSNSLVELKKATIKLSEEELRIEEKKESQDKYENTITDMRKSVKEAEFNDINLLDSSQESYQVAANKGGGTISVGAHDMTGMIDSLEQTPDTPGEARERLSTIAAASDTISAASTALQSDTRKLHEQMDFNSALADAAESTLGASMDPELAKENARQQALQAHQQLSGQSLGIANRAPQSLLSLFQ